MELAASTEPGDIARALSVAMSDAALRENLSQRGRQVAQVYTWDAVGPLWDELLSKVASESICLG